MGMIFTRKIGGSSVSFLDIWLATKDEVELEGIPLSAAFTYFVNKAVETITKGSITKTFTYSPDATVNTINDGTYLKTFVYNPDKTVDEIQVSVI